MHRMYKIAGVFISILVAGGGLWWFAARPASLPDAFGVPITGTTTAGIPAPEKMPTSLPPEELPDGVRRYKNQYHHFTFVYPAELQVQEYVEDNKDRTIVFETPKGERGFQVYITPYAGASVTREQFLKDQPSGVYKSPKDILIDGVPGTVFYGATGLTGETLEVWFIHDGFLYEVTTYKELDSWLSQIMSTWQFFDAVNR